MELPLQWLLERESGRPAPWNRPPLLARAGSVIPLNLAEQHFAQAADARGFAIFPPAGNGEFSDEFFEDDGESEGYRDGRYGLWQIKVSAAADRLGISIKRAGACPPSADSITLILPSQETRRIDIGSATILSDRINEGVREVRLNPE